MHMNDHIHHSSGIPIDLIIALLFVLIMIFYIAAAIISNCRGRKWSQYRSAYFFFGILCAGFAVVGPLANRAHLDFTAHMLTHLLLGMLAPLFLTLAAPATLALRSLDVVSARCLAGILSNSLVRILSHPIFASLLNIGGLWILYTTNLYVIMQHNMLLHLIVHIHVLFAGYLFTASLINIDPTAHRSGFIFRAIVLILALAGHGILSKYIYAHPSISVSLIQAETGAMIMYYGGDLIDLALICVFCRQWFRASRPPTTLSEASI